MFAGACVGMPVGLVLFVMGSANQLRLAVGVVVILAGLLLARGFTLDHASRRDEFVLGAQGERFRRLVLGLMFASGLSAVIAAATH
ncbi:MAG: hypothetical protein EBS32_00195 [Actinobacteria bacterium]|nr:hypothetical protein [Actinomycetota bacterium]